MLGGALPIGCQHTLGHRECPACEAEKLRAMDREQLANLPLKDAAAHWVELRALFLQPRSVHDLKQYFVAICRHFDLPPARWHIGNVREYQRLRAADLVGATRINHEVCALGQLLKDCGRWHLIKPYYRPLPVPREGPGRALSPEEAKKLFDVSKNNPYWRVAFWASILSVNTTCGPGEIRNLRLRDVDIPNQELRVIKGTKNRHRVRVVELNGAALTAARRLLERAREIGCDEPDHYLLPHRGKHYDPTRPQGHWYRAWNAMRKRAGLPNLRLYDLRHTAITWLLENPDVPERVVIELAGHVSNKMLERYSHQRKAARRAAVDRLPDFSLAGD